MLQQDIYPFLNLEMSTNEVASEEMLRSYKNRIAADTVSRLFKKIMQ